MHQHRQAREWQFMLDADVAHHPRDAVLGIPILDVSIATLELLGVHRHGFAAREARFCAGRGQAPPRTALRWPIAEVSPQRRRWAVGGYCVCGTGFSHAASVEDFVP